MLLQYFKNRVFKRGYKRSKKRDPLFVFLEQHLCNSKDSSTDLARIIEAILDEYFEYLDRNNVAVPYHLYSEIRRNRMRSIVPMIQKRTYGHRDLHSFRAGLTVNEKQSIQDRYSSLLG